MSLVKLPLTLPALLGAILFFGALPLASCTKMRVRIPLGAPLRLIGLPTDGRITATITTRSEVLSDRLVRSRAEGAAWVLPDGKVLFAGGAGFFNVADLTSEIFDPSAGKVTEGPNLVVDRQDFVAITLKNGKTLLAGGTGKSTRYERLAEAEIFEPESTSFRATGSMNQARARARAALLASGKVLVVGGIAAGVTPFPVLRQSEVYDPVTETWGELAEMVQPRSNPILARLLDGRVLVAGGSDGTNALRTAEIYDPSTGVWSPTGSMTWQRYQAGVAALPDGRVLVIGGTTGSAAGVSYPALASTEIYDPHTQTWTPGPSLAQPRLVPLVHVDPSSGRVSVLGGSSLHIGDPTPDWRGVDQNQFPMRSVEILDPGAETWKAGPDSYIGHAMAASALLPDGRIVVAGGDSGGNVLGTIEIYSPTLASWSRSRTKNSSPGRISFKPIVLKNGTVLAAGGQDEASQNRLDSELYDPLTHSWRKTGNLFRYKYDAYGARLGNGKVLMLGSYDFSGTELYDPETGTWKETSGPKIFCRGASVVTLANGDALFAGGMDQTVSPSKAYNQSEVFNQKSETWHAVGTLAQPRFDHEIVALPNGKAVAIGGFDGTQMATDLEVYDPAAESWSKLGQLNIPRRQAGAILLKTGGILVVGGFSTPQGYQPTSSAEICDPSSGICRTIQSIKVARVAPTVNLLWDGKVLITGGQAEYSPSGPHPADAEIFDPATETWYSVHHLLSPRTRYTATTLADGRVLFLGGWCRMGLCLDMGIFDYFVPVVVAAEGGTGPYRVSVLNGEADLQTSDDGTPPALVARSGGEITVQVEDSAGERLQAKLLATEADLKALQAETANEY